MFHSLQLVAQAWQPTQVSRSMTRPSFFGWSWPGRRSLLSCEAACSHAAASAELRAEGELVGARARGLRAVQTRAKLRLVQPRGSPGASRCAPRRSYQAAWPVTGSALA